MEIERHRQGQTVRPLSEGGVRDSLVRRPGFSRPHARQIPALEHLNGGPAETGTTNQRGVPPAMSKDSPMRLCQRGAAASCRSAGFWCSAPRTNHGWHTSVRLKADMHTAEYAKYAEARDLGNQ